MSTASGSGNRAGGNPRIIAALSDCAWAGRRRARHLRSGSALADGSSRGSVAAVQATGGASSAPPVSRRQRRDAPRLGPVSHMEWLAFLHQGGLGGFRRPTSLSADYAQVFELRHRAPALVREHRLDLLQPGVKGRTWPASADRCSSIVPCRWGLLLDGRGLNVNWLVRRRVNAAPEMVLSSFHWDLPPCASTVVVHIGSVAPSRRLQ